MLTESQRGALYKFIIKEPQGWVENLENVDHDEQANENVENLGHAHVENDNVINEEEQTSQSIPRYLWS